LRASNEPLRTRAGEEIGLELRLLVAYGLLTLMIVGLSITLLVWRKRRVQRQRRMRGIKTDEAARLRRG
jgi:hypothetical protein